MGNKLLTYNGNIITSNNNVIKYTIRNISGGTITTFEDYTIHTFTGGTEYFVTDTEIDVEYFLVGTGGSGGGCVYDGDTGQILSPGSGGGAGGITTGTTKLSPGSYKVIVDISPTVPGNGLALYSPYPDDMENRASDAIGGTHTFLYTNDGFVDANRGGSGRGGAFYHSSLHREEEFSSGGGSGSGGVCGGDIISISGGTNRAVQWGDVFIGNIGGGAVGGYFGSTTRLGKSGGGGGAGTSGGTATLSSNGIGGDGIWSDFNGVPTYYASGGSVSNSIENGAINTGNGGDGSDSIFEGGKGRAGGSGIAMIRYKTLA